MNPMNWRQSSVYLAFIFFLTALVACLAVLVVVLMLSRDRPLLSLPQRVTPGLVIRTVAPPLVTPPTPTSTAIRLTPPALPTFSMPTSATFAGDSLSLATRIVVIVTSTPGEPTNTPRPLATPRPKPPTPTEGPSPTPTYPDNIRFVQDGDVRLDRERGCLGGAIYGTIRDINGNPVEGVRVKVYNEYITGYSAPSKPLTAPDAGFYDFIINPKPQEWKVVVVDGANNPISPEAEVIRPAGVEVCYFEVDWRAVR